MFSVHFVNHSHGWVAGWGNILHTSDGGQTWEEQMSGVNHHLLGINFTDEDHGWAVGEYGTILFTNNGGDIWSQDNSGTLSWLYSIHFSTPDHGWIVGQTGTILHTDAGGFVAIEDPINTNATYLVVPQPNPFIKWTTLKYSLETASSVSLIIYNEQGQEVQELVNATQGEGTHEVRWNAEGLQAGMYYYRMKTDREVMSGKLMKN